MERNHMFKKCHTCPYASGASQSIIDPCIKCIAQNRKDPPSFGDKIVIKSKKGRFL